MLALLPVTVSQARTVVLHGDRPSYTLEVTPPSGWAAQHGNSGTVLFTHHDQRGRVTDRLTGLPCRALSLVDPTGLQLARQESGSWFGDGARMSARVFQSRATGALYVPMAGGGCLIVRDSGRQPVGGVSEAKLRGRIALARAIRATLGRGFRRSLPAAQRVARSMVARAASRLSQAAAVVIAGHSAAPQTATFVYRLKRGDGYRWDTVTREDRTVDVVTTGADVFWFDAQQHCTDRSTTHSLQHPGFLGELTPAASPWRPQYSRPVKLDRGRVRISITTPWQSISTVISRGGGFTAFRIANRAVPWAGRLLQIIDVTSVQTPSRSPQLMGDGRQCDRWFTE
ncbi:MAG: hypothetical protein QOJ35_2397 [Solirubrobacteraceae bacterium]|jgi:hypothetical protein|nr:hypothetical protein [Solirubrobacteraceae bacterium]